MAKWTNLPEGILDLIISKLFDQDRYNLRLVCQSWNAMAATSPYPIKVPCLIQFDTSKLLWRFFQYNSFFYRSFPEFKNADIECSKYGWLLMCRDDGCRSLFFFNPFNGHTKPIVELYSNCRMLYTSIHFFHPPTSPNCFIIGISTPRYSEDVIIDVLRHGVENKWEKITCKNQYEFLVSNSAPVLHHGLVYFVGVRGDVATLDIERRAWTVYPKCFHRKLRNRITRHFLLKIGDEDSLYAVFMIHDRETVNVFKLLEPEMKWERVKDLGDKMLYLSQPSSFGDVAKPKCMANTICFPIFDPDDDNKLLFYSLKTQRYYSFDGNFAFDNSTSFNIVHQGAAWVTPIPTQQLSTDSVWYSDDDDDDRDGSKISLQAGRNFPLGKGGGILESQRGRNDKF